MKDADVPEADAQEQEQDWTESDAENAPKNIPVDVPEADAIEQSQSVPLDEEDEDHR
jgi:hypothetical protein